MDNPSSPFPNRATRIGFHYFPDSLHYREIDLEIWLPELKALGASWIILQSPLDRAIPEAFISALIKAQIEPIIQFKIAYDTPPAQSDLDILLESYARWGIHGVIFGEKPNSRKSWGTSCWVQKDLVSRFMEKYLPIANLALDKGLNPIFPPLEPGGNFWDLAFLRMSIEYLQTNQHSRHLENLTVSAFAWTNSQTLNWGAGGPERWPEARPYYTPAGEEDHRGLRIFDWYLAVTESLLPQSAPIILLQTGCEKDPVLTRDVEKSVQSGQNEYAIARLLENEVVHAPDNPEVVLEPVSEQVMAANFWLLSDEVEGKYFEQGWYKNGTATAAAEVVKKWFAQPRTPKASRETAPKSAHSSHPIRHYLLLPQYEGGIADWHINMLRPLLNKYAPTIGFSIQEAALASRVTVVGDEEIFSEDLLDELRFSGCQVDRYRGTGMNVAS